MLYAICGALFGCLFPVLATALDLWVHGSALTLANAIDVQRAQSLHWIIDTAPFFLGLFAYVAGLRQEAVEDANALLEKRVEERTAELAVAREAAEEANQAKSRFLANISHELRTPLNAILGYSEMMCEDIEQAKQAEIVADLNKIHGAGTHLLALINDILDLSKVEADKMDVLAEEIRVLDLISEVSATVQALAAKKNNRLVTTPIGTLGTMYTDRTKLRQVLFNLLSNACKFTENGRIDLTVQRTSDDDWLEFKVTDTGIGIKPENYRSLFNAFDQAERTISRDFGGTGLGLAITKRFCELLGGTIEVASVFGEGSTFTVRLPAIAPGEVESAAPWTSEPAGESAGTALVIDDDKTVHARVDAILRGEGYTVLHARGGESGLAMAMEVRPDLITLDIIMADLDGLSVLKALKADPQLRDIPVLMISIIGDRELSMALGAAEVIEKPLAHDELVAAVRRQRKHATGQILLVDDDKDARDLLGRTLTQNGWTVAEAANGQEAIAMIGSVDPTLVLLDLVMPDVDGFGVLRWMRGQPAFRDTPVIIVTAKEPTRRDLDALRDNVIKVLRKGDLDREQLVADIRRVVVHQPPSESASRQQPMASDGGGI